MNIALVAAMDKNRLIGANNSLPWHLPADLAHFKKVTLHKPVVMGRKTFESIGKPLPSRRNIIISRNASYVAAGCEIFLSLEAALAALKTETDIMIIGGGELFKQALPQATTLYLTIIDAKFEGDVFFPDWDANEWQEAESQVYSADADNVFAMNFIKLIRS